MCTRIDNDMIHFENRDCMDGMREFPDKFFDLAIVDPPYGGGAEETKENLKNIRGGGTDWSRPRGRFGRLFDRYYIGNAHGRQMGEAIPTGTTGAADIRNWDIAPPKEYFEELGRISKNQIIWGGNYFDLPPTRCFIVWRKTNIPAEGFSMAPVEYAWTSFSQNAEYIEAFSARMLNEPERIHPTQKPIKLYMWLLQRHAKPGMKIIDTHVGSGSSLIACARMGFEAWGFEIDEHYYKEATERINRELAQGTLF